MTEDRHANDRQDRPRPAARSAKAAEEASRLARRPRRHEPSERQVQVMVEFTDRRDGEERFLAVTGRRQPEQE